MRGADVGSDHHLLMAKVRLRIAKVRKGDSGRVRFDVSKLKDLEVRNAFKLALHNRFEGLQQLMEEEELQEGTRVEPTGEAKERETPTQLETHENGRVGGEACYVE